MGSKLDGHPDVLCPDVLIFLMLPCKLFIWAGPIVHFGHPGVSFEAGGQTYHFSFHVQYFDTDIWEFFYFLFSFELFYFFYLLNKHLLLTRLELQPCLRNAGNNVSECSVLQISWGSMPPDPRKVRASCSAKTNFTSGAFTCNDVRYFTKLLKTLDTQYSNLGQKPAGGQMFRAEIKWRKLHLNQIDKCSLEWKKVLISIKRWELVDKTV